MPDVLLQDKTTSRIDSASATDSGTKEFNFRRELPWIGALALLLVACYLPVLTTQYGFSDDYRYLGRAWKEPGWPLSFLPEGFISGRPLATLTLWYTFVIGSTTSTLVLVRQIATVYLALLSGLLYYTLRKSGRERLTSLCLTAIMCSLPAFQVVMSWTCVSIATLLMFLSGISCLLADRSFAEPVRWRKLSLAGASALTLLVVLASSQCYAMFFWVFAAILLFRPGASANETIRKFLWYFGIFAVACVFEFGIYQLGKWLYVGSAASRVAAGRLRIATDLAGKISWFVQEPLQNALNLGRLFPSTRTALVTGGFIIAGLPLYLPGNFKQRAIQVAIALSLIPLTYLPPLAAAENWATYRTIIALSPLLAMYVFFAACGFAKFLPPMPKLRVAVPALLSGLAAIALVTAFCNVYLYFAVPQSLELKLVRDAMFNQGKPRLLRLKREETLVGKYRYDEFGTPTTFQDFVIDPLTYLLVREHAEEQGQL